MKPAIKLTDWPAKLDSGGLFAVDLARLAAEGVIRGGVYVLKSAYDYARKCHWWI